MDTSEGGDGGATVLVGVDSDAAIGAYVVECEAESADGPLGSASFVVQVAEDPTVDADDESTIPEGESTIPED